MGTPPGWREKPRTGGAGGTGSPWRGQRAAGTERLAVPGDRAVREGGSAGVPSGSRRWEAHSAPHGAEPPCPGAAPQALRKRPRRNAEHRAPRAARTRSFPAGDGRGERRSPRGTGRRSSPHKQHVSPGASSLFPSDAGAQSCAGRADPARSPSHPPQPRTSRPPQSPRTPLRSGQRGNRLPLFPPRLLTICLNLLHLLFRSLETKFSLLPSPFPPPSHAFVWKMPRIAHQLLLSPPTSIFTPIYALVNSRSAAPPPRTYPTTTCKHLAC